MAVTGNVVERERERYDGREAARPKAKRTVNI
jgi:hypothetical protein